LFGRFGFAATSLQGSAIRVIPYRGQARHATNAAIAVWSTSCTVISNKNGELIVGTSFARFKLALYRANNTVKILVNFLITNRLCDLLTRILTFSEMLTFLLGKTNAQS